MEYVIPIKEIDLKKFVNFSSVFSKPKEGSQVDLGQKYSDNILNILYQKNMLPIPFNKFVQLIQLAIQDTGVDINFLFLKKIVLSYYENSQIVILEVKNMNLVIDFKKEETCQIPEI